MENIESAGVEVALPSQAIFLAGASISTGGRVEAVHKALAPDKKTNDQASARSA
jgi:hypothetical protein